MSKYNFELELNDQTCTGMVIKEIREHSTVLEFGCAYGRMTKYLQESMKCKVYIVEKDEEAYQEARKYACDGFCGDILDGEWENLFPKENFDYVLFVDVLEHLIDPVRALSMVKPYLKEDGIVLFSYPNIAHSDVVNNLYNNNFQYTSVGLLDDTHIHFVCKKNLKALCEDAGYKIGILNRTRIQPFCTEQKEFMDNDEYRKNRERILGRMESDTYQYVCTLYKSEWFEANSMQIEERNETVPYGMQGMIWAMDDSEKKHVITITPKYTGGYCYVFQIENSMQWTNICFLPVSSEKYYLRNIKIICSDSKIDIHDDDYKYFGNTLVPRYDDSCLKIQCNECDKFEIEIEVYMMDNPFSDDVNDKLKEDRKMNDKIIIDEKRINQLVTAHRFSKNENQADYFGEVERLKGEIAGLKWDLADAQRDANRLAVMYLSTYENGNPWLSVGLKRSQRKIKMIESEQEVKIEKPKLKDTPKIHHSNAQCFDQDQVNWNEVYPASSTKGGKIAVQVHLYYEDLLEEFAGYFANIPFYFDMYVSCTNRANKAAICKRFAEIENVQKVVVRVTQNRGRDMAPVYVLFAKELLDYDYLLHVHSKKSLYTGTEQCEWRIGALNTLCGSEMQVRKIFGVLQSNKNVGIYCPEMEAGLPFWACSWLQSKGIGMRLAGEMGFEFQDGIFNYPVGSFFWAKIDAIRPLLEKRFEYTDFDEECGQTDGTLAHALERAIVFVSKSRGYSIAIGDSEEGIVRFGKSEKALERYFNNDLISSKEMLLRYTAVSFDIFDTLITRKIYQPDDLFLNMEEQLKRKFGIEVDFLKNRKEAEYKANQEKGANTNIDDIYAQLPSVMDVSVEIAEQIKQLEIEMEYELCVPRKDVLELYRFLKNKGIKIYLVSDMYLTSDIIRKMLVKCGYDDDDELYLSCEVGKRKDDSTMWVHMKEIWNGQRVIHVGDNLCSDVQRPSDLGIETYPILNSNDLCMLTSLYQVIKNRYKYSAASSYIIGNLINVELFNSPFALENSRTLKSISNDLAGQAMFGALLTGFIQKIDRNVNAEQVLLFLAREGYFLQKLYNAYMECRGEKQNKSSYFLASRRSTGAARIKSINDVREILQDYYRGDLGNLLYTRLGIEIANGNNIYVEMPEQLEIVMDIIEDNFDNVIRIFEEQRCNYLKYIESELGQIDNNNLPVVIDLGYSGTIQYNLAVITGKLLEGYYLFTEKNKKPMTLGCVCRSVIDRKKDECSELFSRSSLYLESVLQAPYGQLIKFEKKGGEVVPQYGKADLVDETIYKIQDAILMFAKQFAGYEKFCGGHLEIDMDLAIHIFISLANTQLLPFAFKHVFAVEDNYCGNGVKKVDVETGAWL